MKRIIFILLINYLITPGIIAQDQEYIDSLIQQLDYQLNDIAKIDMLNKIADDFLYINSDKMNDYSRQALELSEEIDYKKGIAESYNNLSIFFGTKGIYDKAIDYVFKSLKIMQEENNRIGIARCYNIIGIINYYLNNDECSIEYFNKALEINIEINDKKWIAGNFNNLGMIYERMGDYNKALEYYFKSLKTNKELNNKNWIGNNYGNIGILYQRMGKPESLEYFFKRLKINERQGDMDGISSTNYYIGNYYNSQNEFEKALPYLLISYNIADSLESLAHLNNSANGLSVTFAGLNNYKQSYKFHKIYKTLSDSLNFEKNTQKITRLKMQNQFRKDQYLNELEYQKTKLIFITIAGALFVFVVITILLFRRQQAKSKYFKLKQKKHQLENQLLQEKLEFKGKELQDNVKYLVNKNELITSVSERLIEEKPRFKKENQNVINEVILELQLSIDSDIWEEFELRFKQVHSYYYEILNKKFPHLSANDKKLCAFLRLNMSSREISAITHQSIKSIETARIRLRKKLNISNKDIGLADFLSQF